MPQGSLHYCLFILVFIVEMRVIAKFLVFDLPQKRGEAQKLIAVS
jgi:hypothetical protein